MGKKSRRIKYVMLGMLVFLTAVSLILARGAQKTYRAWKRGDMTILDTVTVSVNGGAEKTVHLPCEIATEPGDTVTVTAEAEIQERDMLYAKTVYSPLVIALDGEEIARLGEMQYYPSFMKDPATEVKFIPLDETGKKTLTMTFAAPHNRSYVALNTPMIGRTGPITSYLGKRMAPAWILSYAQIMIGILILTVTAAAWHMLDVSELLWTGVFALTAGVWGICENNLTQWMIDRPAVLYLLDFMALDCVLIPVVNYVRSVVRMPLDQVDHFVDYLVLAAPVTALVLQLSGLMPLYQSVKAFHILLPCIFLFLLIESVNVYRTNHDRSTQHLLIALTIIIIAGLTEVINYYAHFIWMTTMFFETGLSVFIIYSGVIGLKSVQRSVREKETLEMEMQGMEIQTKEMARHASTLVEQEKQTRRQRHDMRQMLIYMEDLAENGDREGMLEFLHTMMDDLPKRTETYCENPTLNAIVSYYAGECARRDIRFDVHIAVPEEIKELSDREISALFGNLLENGMQACERMDTGEKYVTLRVSAKGKMLVIAMENSFSGQAKKAGNLYVSSKRPAVGIGLSSIRTIAKNHRGDALFAAEGNVFSSKVYLYLG